MSGRSNKFSPYLFISPALLLFGFVVLVPVLMTFVFSFYDWNGIGTMKFTGFDNYIRAFQDRVYMNSYGHTLIYIVATVFVEVIAGLGLAGLITMGRKGSGLFRLAFFVPVMLPMIVVSYLWKFVYNSDFGLINILLEKIGLESWTRVWLGNPDTALYAICIVSGWVYAGFYMTIFYSGIQRISREVYESAYLDGAGEGQIFFKIKVPMIRNLVETGIMLCVLTGFQSFDLFYVMTNGGPYNSTEIVTTYLVKVVFTHMSIGYGSALAVIMTIVIAVIGLVAGRLNKKDSSVLEY
ncbi:binding-protein-dependent transporters inner membrane component [Paenibacillus sp. FSL R7-277]|uniref:Raffinose/stachyose/melibiose transport system permease protein n=2 Tax=Paenibacillus silagei TaxID=1670801 RepID=A0ABS4NV79_9BACL|nr:sugar ABC transporter permease [Paenibacillus sp. FSL R7-277]ETT75964.1 binding-protein-dependent transporters inner membrane component [Paenibacillus sp. FSL R7-277]MBP2113972.1 raffinose/stachyose/melibiose transport system permease protein [Paenibacillus silagei]OMG00783.1 sugar ABC transporter permease [Paenibacillus sp. FSL R7-0333]